MEKKREIKNFTVKYNSDPRLVTDNHMSNPVHLLDTDERSFNEISEAITFLNQCINPITTIEQLVPELNSTNNNNKKFKYLLPETHIKVKHQVTNNIEMYAQDDAFDWK